MSDNSDLVLNDREHEPPTAQRWAAFLMRLLCFAFCVGLASPEPALANRKRESGFGLLPCAGYGFLSGGSIDEMNKRLGNSPRLSQGSAFGRQFVYGVQAGYWAGNQRVYLGASYLESSKTLTGSSSFDGVSGASTLSLSGQLLQLGLRLAPLKTSFNPRKPRGILERIKLTTMLSLGNIQLEHTNSVQDSGSFVDVSYSYSSLRLATGGQLVFAYALNHWFHLILFDARAHFLANLDSEVGIKSYTVSGRNEASLAESEIRKALGKDILMYQLLWGIEVTL